MKMYALLASIVVLLGTCAALTVQLEATKNRLKSQQEQTKLVQEALERERMTAEFAASAAQMRLEASKEALMVAVEAGRSNRAAASTYLALPVPAPETRCEAAQELIDQAIQERTY